ncbi:unnamed protein product [Caenorhabditis bovis]|uniref:Uncharacterized protein n=1 Tax=Caenorhabditis bovis TaxID=2654633 RepID=A0A8S1E7R8_9PELO|nr:unnamed protein product [Caenorhabditis bovis]
MTHILAAWNKDHPNHDFLEALVPLRITHQHALLSDLMMAAARKTNRTLTRLEYRAEAGIILTPGEILTAHSYLQSVYSAYLDFTFSMGCSPINFPDYR